MTHQTPPPGGFYPQPPKHESATTVLVLGILGLVLCGVLAPFAWVMGNRALREIDASQGRLGGRSEVNAGRILGIVGTALLVLGVVVFIGFVAVALIAGVETSSTGSGY